MDGFEVFSLDAVGDDALFLVESGGHVANDVFDELRMIVGVFRDVLFVGALQAGPELAGGGLLAIGDLLFEAHRSGKLDGGRQAGALVVSAVAGDFLGAGAEARHGSGSFLTDGDDAAAAVGNPGGLVVHEAGELADGGALADEEREAKLDRAVNGVKTLEHVGHERADDVHVERFGMLFHERDKAGHVRALFVCRKRHGHFDGGDGGKGVFLGLHRNGNGDAANADAVDGDVAAVARGLNVRKSVFVICVHKSSLVAQDNCLEAVLGMKTEHCLTGKLHG